MKCFADDYYEDAGQQKVQAVWGRLDRYKRSHTHGKSGWHPSWDLYETEKLLIVLVELAGLTIDDMDVVVGENSLNLRGKRWRPFGRQITRIHHMEIDFGFYQQTIAFPKSVDPGGSILSYRDGLLLIRLPKEEKSAVSNAP